ncbi:MAG: heavy metal translocating P-type ATPase [Pseudomonadales bacterium]|nr:heavy metal translocating P-type ATPase [Pseudomonadales bacterium]NRA17627.1 copper-translocating P-type ATPase [Oceanospirillaceae bacterium]
MSAPSKVQFFSLQGITCAGCVRSVDKALLNLQQQQPELESFSINFADRTAIISGNLADDQVITAIRNAGYDASLVESEQDREQIEQAEQQYLKVTLYRSVAALGTGAAMMALQMSGVIAPLSSTAGQLQALLMALISAAIMFFCAAKIYRGAWQSLKTLAFNMDILIALGTLSAWVYSAVLLILMSLSLQVVPEAAQHLYFEAAVVILGFILLGQSLEARVRGSTARAVQSLINMQPKLAWRQDKQGEFQEVPVQLLIPGDIVLVKPGEAIPVDGVVVAGSSAVDESMISGESVAVAKVQGDSVIGSTVNASGSLTFRVTQVGSHTMLAQIIAQVRRAQNSKPALGRLADKIAAVFVPIVLVIALFTALIWWWYAPVGNWSYVLTATMTVLIVACPCALGLATPMSTMVGVGLAAKRGILIQNGDALQVAEDLTTVVLDKTGTITAGKPSVTDSLFLHEDVDQSEVYNWLLQIEQKSEHPLAQALVDFSSEQDFDATETASLTDFNSVTSAGVSANFAGVEVKVGSLTWLAQGLSEEAQAQAEQWMSQAKSVVVMSVAGRALLLLAISDPIKADSAAAIAQLQQRGLKVIILSGDKEQSVAAIARQVAITDYRGGLSSEQKLQEISRLQQRGEVVAMVGDGVNDAPALAMANLGCAIGTGTDVAINSADITLIHGSLTTLNDAIEISRLTLKNIKQNLFGAFIYNIIAIPVAAGVLYPAFAILLNPMVAGAAMALSSITVVSNAYRLSYKIDKLS